MVVWPSVSDVGWAVLSKYTSLAYGFVAPATPQSLSWYHHQKFVALESETFEVFELLPHADANTGLLVPSSAAITKPVFA